MLKHFNSCNPPKFKGSEGATGILQWFEAMENTFINSECPDDLKVTHAAGVFLGPALTWWNGEKRTRGSEAALALSWDEMKVLMTAEFCPRSEIKKLEAQINSQPKLVVQYPKLVDMESINSRHWRLIASQVR